MLLSGEPLQQGYHWPPQLRPSCCSSYWGRDFQACSRLVLTEAGCTRGAEQARAAGAAWTAADALAATVSAGARRSYLLDSCPAWLAWNAHQLLQVPLLLCPLPGWDGLWESQDRLWPQVPAPVPRLQPRCGRC